MTNEDILDIVRKCDLRQGEELVSGEAYLFNRKFRMQISGKTRYEPVEIIVLVKNKVKVGGIFTNILVILRTVQVQHHLIKEEHKYVQKHFSHYLNLLLPNISTIQTFLKVIGLLPVMALI